MSVSVRTIERAVADLRRASRASALATVRVESPPGDQLQIDFGQKRVPIGGVEVRVFFLVAVLSYSRRLFVKAFLSERQADWREGIAAAFTYFIGDRGAEVGVHFIEQDGVVPGCGQCGRRRSGCRQARDTA